jgi:hypothetical protein
MKRARNDTSCMRSWGTAGKWASTDKTGAFWASNPGSFDSGVVTFAGLKKNRPLHGKGRLMRP